MYGGNLGTPSKHQLWMHMTGHWLHVGVCCSFLRFLSRRFHLSSLGRSQPLVISWSKFSTDRCSRDWCLDVHDWHARDALNCSEKKVRTPAISKFNFCHFPWPLLDLRLTFGQPYVRFFIYSGPSAFGRFFDSQILEPPFCFHMLAMRLSDHQAQWFLNLSLSFHSLLRSFGFPLWGVNTKPALTLRLSSMMPFGGIEVDPFLDDPCSFRLSLVSRMPYLEFLPVSNSKVCSLILWVTPVCASINCFPVQIACISEDVNPLCSTSSWSLMFQNMSAIKGSDYSKKMYMFDRSLDDLMTSVVIVCSPTLIGWLQSGPKPCSSLHLPTHDNLFLGEWKRQFPRRKGIPGPSKLHEHMGPIPVWIQWCAGCRRVLASDTPSRREVSLTCATTNLPFWIWTCWFGWENTKSLQLRLSSFFSENPLHPGCINSMLNPNWAQELDGPVVFEIRNLVQCVSWVAMKASAACVARWKSMPKDSIDFAFQSLFPIHAIPQNCKKTWDTAFQFTCWHGSVFWFEVVPCRCMSSSWVMMRYTFIYIYIQIIFPKTRSMWNWIHPQCPFPSMASRWVAHTTELHQ